MEQHEMVDTAPIEKLIDKIGADTVFGSPITENGTMIIPVAQTEFGFGYGGGVGVYTNDNEIDNTAEVTDPTGGGGGGGAGGRTTPRGYIHIEQDEVSYRPIEDGTRIPLAGIFMVAWNVFWVMATVRAVSKAVAKTKQKQAERAGQIESAV